MTVAPRRWHLITGEYPPQPGGVADYTRLLAQGLAAKGDKVIVWAPEAEGPTPHDGSVVVRRLPGNFGPAALSELDAALARWRGRVLLQYVPHAFGCRAMNLPLCAWLWARSWQVDVMFHEVAWPFLSGQPLKHTVLAGVHRLMASLLLRSAQRVFVATPSWGNLLRPLARPSPEPTWMPVPSNLPVGVELRAVEQVRGRLLRGNGRLLGHFGTFNGLVTNLLEPALVEVLAGATDVHCLLVGQGSREYAEGFLKRHPNGADRVTATGILDPGAAAAHVAACDLLVQPYPDGISSRRSSAMAALAQGCAVVTTSGHATEPIWRESDAVDLVPVDQLGAAALTLLGNSPGRRALGRRAAHLYREHFALEHTVRALRTIWSAALPETSATGLQLHRNGHARQSNANRVCSS